MKKILAIILVMIMSMALFACGEGSGVASCNVYATTYDNINTVSDPDAYASEANVGGVDQGNNNNPVDDGIIVSPYYTLKVNDKEVPVYGTRTANGIHSFVYLSIEDTGDAGFNLKMELKGTDESTVFKSAKSSVVVLPESHGVATEMDRENKLVTCNINSLGSFSFVFNKKEKEPLTVMVTEKIDTTKLFGNYEVVKIPVGDYSTASSKAETLFAEKDDAENKVYYFQKGKYQVDKITLPSNSILYLEEGAYIEAIPEGSKGAYDRPVRTPVVFVENKENVTIAGRGLFDFSKATGSTVSNWYTNDKDTFIINDCKNVKFYGITSINSQHWTLNVNSTENIHVKNVFFFAYRMYADGVMLSNCRDSLVEFSFIRTGDDAFETKSARASEMVTNNVIFQYCDAWTDKANAYGCVYECYNDTRNVLFRNCSVGFALGTWSAHLGSCIIQLGQTFNPNRITENITFENIEIYHSKNRALLNCYIGGTGGSSVGAGIIQNIYFKNITCANNYGKVLHVATYPDLENNRIAEINDLYLQNIVSNKTKITSANIEEHFEDEYYNPDSIYGGAFDRNKLHIS